MRWNIRVDDQAPVWLEPQPAEGMFNAASLRRVIDLNPGPTMSGRTAPGTRPGQSVPTPRPDGQDAPDVGAPATR